jgi:hypothetical protein
VFEDVESGRTAVPPSLDAEGKVSRCAFCQGVGELGEVRGQAYGVLPLVERLRLGHAVEQCVEERACSS